MPSWDAAWKKQYRAQQRELARQLKQERERYRKAAQMVRAKLRAEKAAGNPGAAIKMISRPKGWVRADAVRVTRNKGRLLVEIRRRRVA